MSNHTPTVREAQLLAHLDEAEALIASLRARTVTLNGEIRARDVEIAALRVRVEAADLAGDTESTEGEEAP